MHQHLFGLYGFIVLVCLNVSVERSSARPDGDGQDLNNNNQITSVRVNNYIADNPNYEAEGSAYLEERASEPAYENNNNNNYESLYKSESSKAYEKDDRQDNDNKEEYGTYKKKELTLANVIPQAQDPERLDEIYHAQGIGNGQVLLGNNSDNNNGTSNAGSQKILLYIKFARDFSQWNPRNPKSVLKWLTSRTSGLTSDNAAFQIVNNKNDNQNKNNDVYSNKQSSANEKVNAFGGNKSSGKNYVKMSSLPFTSLLRQAAWTVTKNNFAIGEKERLLSRMRMSCKTIGVEQNPFNTTEVADAVDDPRLASCAFQLGNANGTTPRFWMAATNKGIWAIASGDTFVAKRKVGVRNGYDSLIDVGIELNRRLGAVNYYLNGYKVWTINAIGVPPPNDGLAKIDLGTTSTPTIVSMTEVSLSFGVTNCLDESDPNQPNNPVLLVRMADPGDLSYSNTTRFYDPNGLPSNINWGQGAILKLYKWIVVKTESKTPKLRQALAGVYGR